MDCIKLCRVKENTHRKAWNKFWGAYDADDEPFVTADEFPMSKIPRCGKVLEIGFGSGRVLAYFYKKGYKIYGIDISPKAIDAILLRPENEKQYILSKICLGDCCGICFKDKSFETIICLGLLEHYHDYNNISKCLNEMNRILTDTGIAVVSVPHRISAFIVIELFKRLVGKWDSGVERKFFPRDFMRIIRRNNFVCACYYARPMDITPAKGIFRVPALVLKVLDKLLVDAKIGGHMTTYILTKNINKAVF